MLWDVIVHVPVTALRSGSWICMVVDMEILSHRFL